MQTPQLPPERPQKSKGRGRRLGCLIALGGLVVCGGCLQGVLYWALPPYTWLGWIDGERKAPPAWHVEMPKDNARDVYDGMIPLLPTGESETAMVDAWLPSASANRGQVTVDEAALAQGEAYIARHQGVLDNLHLGADKRYVSGKPASPDTLFPEFAKYRSAARLACVQARLLHERGRDDEALRTLEDASALGVNLNNGESLIQALVGIACIAMADRSATTVILDGEPSADALRAHARRVRALRERLPGMAGTLTCEAAFADSALDMIAESRISEVTGVLGGDEDMEPLSRPRAVLARMKLPSSREWIHDRYARLIEEVDKPPAASKFEELSARTDMDADARDDWVAQMLMGGYAKAATRYRGMVAQLAAEEILCALELYRREHGAYPAKLADLTPAYLPDVPVDPFTENSMVYRVTPTGYKLYALGPNRADDGGVSEKRGFVEPDQVFVTGESAPAGTS
jgi:hypothetical protein